MLLNSKHTGTHRHTQAHTDTHRHTHTHTHTDRRTHGPGVELDSMEGGVVKIKALELKSEEIRKRFELEVLEGIHFLVALFAVVLVVTLKVADRQRKQCSWQKRATPFLSQIFSHAKTKPDKTKQARQRRAETHRQTRTHTHTNACREKQTRAEAYLHALHFNKLVHGLIHALHHCLAPKRSNHKGHIHKLVLRRDDTRKMEGVDGEGESKSVCVRVCVCACVKSWHKHKTHCGLA